MMSRDDRGCWPDRANGSRAGARIVAVGDYRPERVVTNAELAETLDTTAEWMEERSGIRARLRASPHESVVDLGVAAGRAVLDQVGADRPDIGLVLVATITHFRQTPAAATVIADRLGLSPAAAFDLSAGCAGFCYGLGVARDVVRSGSAEYALVIGADKMSDFVDPKQREVAFLFGDGGGAALVGPCDRDGISETAWGSEGSGAPAMGQDLSWLSPWEGTPGPAGAGPDGVGAGAPRRPHFRMDGRTVFRWAVKRTAEVARTALAKAGMKVDDIDVLVTHQANGRIIDALVERLGLGADVVVAKDLVTVGNTSAASVPMALASVIRDGRAVSGDKALLIGFGAGLCYAAQVVDVP